ncbi:hypothetical protein [Streptomyces olivaceoviridis]
MTDDLHAGPAPEPAPRPHGPDELSALAAPRRLSVDDHMFTAPGLPGTFRLQLFTADGARPVAVAIQVAGAEGTSLMNGAETFAGAVWERHCPEQDQPPVWVERQLWPQGPLEETCFQRVMFDGGDRYRPRGPKWSVITHEQLQDLVGAQVAKDRGAGYVPRAAEPPSRRNRSWCSPSSWWPALLGPARSVSRRACRPGCPGGAACCVRYCRAAAPGRVAGTTAATGTGSTRWPSRSSGEPARKA